MVEYGEAVVEQVVTEHLSLEDQKYLWEQDHFQLQLELEELGNQDLLFCVEDLQQLMVVHQYLQQ